MTTDRFLLDSDYENFTSNEQLKFSSVNGLDKISLGCSRIGIFIFIPITFLLLSLTSHDILLERAYQTEGRAVDVTVTRCQTADLGRRGEAPKLTYSYNVNGVAYSDSDTVITTPDDDCDDYPAGLMLPALYLASDPQQSRLRDAVAPSYANFSYLMYGVGCLLVGGMCVFMLYNLVTYQRDVWRYKRLKRSGMLLDGEIVETRGSMGDKSQHYNLSISYRFQTPNGKTLIRKQKGVRDDIRSNNDHPLAGTPVSVLYADDAAVVML